MDDEGYLKLCRLCLSKPEGKIALLHEQKDEIQAAISDVELEERGDLSQLICHECTTFIQKISEFKQQIRKNQEFLLNLILKHDAVGQFLEVNVDIVDDAVKNESVRPTMPVKSDPEMSDDASFNNDSDSDEYSEKSSLSENDYAKPDLEHEPKSDKLPLPRLEFEKNKNSVWCPFCYIKFKHKYFLSKHGKLRHPEYNWAFRKPRLTRTQWECKFCDKVYSRRFRLKEHALVEHFGKNPFECDICGFTTPLKNGIRHHISNTHLKQYATRKPKETIICDICNHVSSTKDVHYSHIRCHQESEERPFSCRKCRLFFRTQKTLDKHNRHTHIIENLPFPCNLCISARFVSDEVLQLHIKRHECDEARRVKQPFACTACELRFCKKQMLDNHVRYHEKNELDSCQVCGVTLHRSSVPDHRGRHEMKYEEYKSVCHLCGRRFRMEWSLLKHLKTHDSPQFFECDKCGKTIKRKCNFAKHVKKCQGPNKEFICQFCGQKFPTKSAKYKHEDKIHKGFSCKRCNMRFDRYQALKVHRRTLEHKKTGKLGKLLYLEASSEIDGVKIEGMLQ